jgi:hypothetical protein
MSTSTSRTGRALRTRFRRLAGTRRSAGRRVPAAGDRPELRRLLAAALAEGNTGEALSPEDLERLRRLAVGSQLGDTDGVAVAALTVLAERFDDQAARSWIAPALAQAGRFAEAAAIGPTFAPGRPRAGGYAILATALWALGRDQEAAAQLRRLEQRFPGLRSEFVHIWGDDPLSAAFRGLYQTSPAHRGVLPVFQHLPFCAGTSMQYSQRQVVPWARTLQIGRRWGMLQIEQALQLPQAELDQLMLVHQHHPFALRLPGRELSHFTVLRDPVSQIRSGFYKRQVRDKIISTRDDDSTDFSQHAEFLLAGGLTNMLTRMIITTHPALESVYRRQFRSRDAYTAISSEEDMFWVQATRGFTEDKLLQLARETLDENFHVVGTMTHLAAGHLACSAAIGVPLAHAIVHRGKSGQPRRPEPGSVEQRLRDANGVDQQLFDEYTRRFEARYPELITAVESPAELITGSAASAR